MAQNSQFIETFREESFELLGTLENDLLALEKSPNDNELISSVFRVMHTIKGSAAMFGFDVISAFAHRTESILSDVRDGKLAFTADIASSVLKARDILLGMLDDPGSAIDPERGATGSSGAAGSAGSAGPAGPAAEDGESETWHVLFKPDKSVLARGVNPFKLVRELTRLGEAVCVPELASVPAIETIKDEWLADGWNVFLTTDAGENAIRDVFIFVEGDCELKVTCLSHAIDESGGEVKKLGEILIEQGKLDEETLRRILGTKKRLGDTLIEQNIVSATSVQAALEEQKQLQKVQSERKAKNELSTLRVKSEKLDALMALVSELVTVHAQIRETAVRAAEAREGDGERGIEEIIPIVEQFGRLMDSLRDTTMEIRMVPVGTNFSLFRRLVRDLSAELGKKVDFATSGEATELDKSVIEKLHDPLVHIIRNSLDHGIETPDLRAARGKAETGTITLSATQAGANVLITIEDDGNGLDRKAILDKAISKGLVKPGEQLGEQDIYKLIFLPGFSTKKTVTSVSGRGVGMDVVNRQMEEIGGKISVESEEAKGTRITLAIPLTLAIIDGLFVRCGEERFVIPLSSVTGCLEFTRESRRAGKDAVEYRGHLLPYVDLCEYFAVGGTGDETRQIVVVSAQGEPYGALVDRIEGMNQTVIKPLDGMYRNARGISGATIRGDGSISLILDIDKIMRDDRG